MDFVAKNLANGQAPSSKTTIYTVPGGRSSIVRSFLLVNTYTTDVVINFTVNFGTGSRHCAPKDLTISPNNMVEFDHSITLESGDFLEVQASIAGVVDYVASGVEQQ